MPSLRLVSKPLIWRSSPRKSGRWCRPLARAHSNNVIPLCRLSSLPKQGRKRVADRILPDMMNEEETIAIRTGEEFDFPKVEQYLRSHIAGLGAGSLHVRQFP